MATCTCGIDSMHARTAPADCPKHQTRVAPRAAAGSPRPPQQTHKGPAALASSGPQRRPVDGNNRTVPIIDLRQLLVDLQAREQAMLQQATELIGHAMELRQHAEHLANVRAALTGPR